MSPFLTVKEAGALVNKSPSSIRRIIYPILEDDKHADRHFIEPPPEAARELRMKGEGFAWRISEELLRRVVPAETSSEKGSGTPPERDHGEGNGALLDMLRRELDIKNTQITQQSELISKQMELIGGLSERLREGNVLIGTLQQQFKLTDGKDRTIDARETKPKRGVFSRLFSKSNS